MDTSTIIQTLFIALFIYIFIKIGTWLIKYLKLVRTVNKIRGAFKGKLFKENTCKNILAKTSLFFI